MNELQAASAALTSLKTAFDIAKTMVGLRDSNLVREKVLELNGAILEAQEQALAANAAQSALVKRIDNLETEIARMKAWDGEKERYQLNRYTGGILVYSVKPGMEAGEPEHHLCANCFQHREKSILQPETQNPGRILVLRCLRCKTDLIAQGHRDMARR